MKGQIKQLNVLFALTNKVSNWKRLKQETKLRDIELSRTLKFLSKMGYVKKRILPKKRVEYSITENGKKYLKSLASSLLKNVSNLYVGIVDIAEKLNVFKKVKK